MLGKLETTNAWLFSLKIDLDTFDNKIIVS